METFARLQNMVADREAEIGPTFQTLGSRLRDSGESCSIQFQIIDADTPRQWHLTIEPGSSQLAEGQTDSPDLDILTDSDSWWAIATGSLSPIEAFLGGRMRIRGDVELGKRLLAEVAVSPGKTSC
jgi:putative sterol carrier protein